MPLRRNSLEERRRDLAQKWQQEQQHLQREQPEVQDYPDRHHGVAHGEGHELLQGKLTRSKTVSQTKFNATLSPAPARQRRGSLESRATRPKSFLLNVDETQRRILQQEDTDGNFQITVQDAGPKAFAVGTANSFGYRKEELRGHYMLSNLLQELSLANDYGRQFIVVDESRLSENPVSRLLRLIKYHFWDALTRRIDGEGMEVICRDPKNRSADQRSRIYVPYHDHFALEYYMGVASERPHLNLDVVRLPEFITPQYVFSINDHPGILSLDLWKTTTEEGNLLVKGAPFVVPGGRFNEMYGWDSYFEALGLLQDGRVSLARGMVENFVYEIEHYGKVMNANRSYYLCRSQPPFLTDMALQVANYLKGEFPLKSWLRRCFRAALKDLLSVWLAPPRLHACGLVTYYPSGIKIPPETEATHFTAVLLPWAQHFSMSVDAFADAYNRSEVEVPELDEYFLHDRAVRESGHDTTYRLDGQCAYLATVDLNSLVYKYLRDFERTLAGDFEGRLGFHLAPGRWDEFLAWVQHLQAAGTLTTECIPVPGTEAPPALWDSSWASHLRVSRDILLPEEEMADLHEVVVGGQHVLSYRRREDDCTIYLLTPFFSGLADNFQRLFQRHCWNAERRLYFDYHVRQRARTDYVSATVFWTLWSGIASRAEAEAMIPVALELLECEGGLVSGTEESRGLISLARPNRQWDYPYGWAPHQILAWVGLERYGYLDVARRLAYRWLYMITVNFVDYNGVIPEKYDVVKVTHQIDVEYGNVGIDFKCVVKEGFGWMNASYVVGHAFLSKKLKSSLGALVPPDRAF